jgi:hypothetical protein
MEDEELRRQFAEINAKLDTILARVFLSDPPEALTGLGSARIERIEQMMADLQAKLGTARRSATARVPRAREIIKRVRHDGCGSQAGRVELFTGIEAASSRPVRMRRIVVIDG